MTTSNCVEYNSYVVDKYRILDDIDSSILNIIQNNARITNAEIARRVKMAPSGVLERVRKLEKRGIIRGYEARLDAEAAGKGLIAFLFIKTDESVGETGVPKRIAEIPEVLEVHTISGEDCYLVKLRVGSAKELSRLMKERFGKLKSIRATRTTIVLETFKETGIIPLGISKTKASK